MAAIGADLWCELRADCQLCVDAFKYGLARATTDRRIHARVHEMMFEAWGDIDSGAMVCMPALHEGRHR